jgi:hypothetical protein
MPTNLQKILMGGGAAAAAFDPSTVTGYSRDWNFADITKIYTDTAGTILATTDGDPIGAILCSAGSTIKLAAAADTNRPTYETGIQNGLSVARFDGSDDLLRNLTGITADASQTVFLVARKNSAPAAATKAALSITLTAFLFTNTAVGTGYCYGQNEAAGNVAIGGTPANWNIIALKYTSAASLSVYINGGAATTFDPHDSYATGTDFWFGAKLDGSADGDYDIGRALVYSAALADADMNTVFSGLGALWGITVTPVS